MNILDRLLVRYLRWRGWVVFWLDPIARHCGLRTSGSVTGLCWMQEYEQDRRRREAREC